MGNEELFKDVAPEEGEVEEITEFRTEDLSNKRLGDKYVRPNLGGQTVKIRDCKIFGARKEDPVKQGTSGKSQYKKCNLVVYYDTPNEDRETYSGCIQFVRKDGSLSPPNIYHAGNSQAANLLKTVAAKLGKKPEDMSMVEFVKFLKGGASAKLKQETFSFQGKQTTKNVIESFI